MMTRQRFIALSALAALILCGGCLMPRDFTAKLDVRKDGSYDFTYEGTMTHAVMAQDRQDGLLTPEEEKKTVDELLSALAGDPRIASIAYMGDDVFTLSYRCSGNLYDGPMQVFSKDWLLFDLRLTEEDDVPFGEFSFMEKLAADLAGEDEEKKAMRRLYPMRGAIVLSSELPVSRLSGKRIKADGAETYTWTVESLTGRMPRAFVMLDKAAAPVEQPQYADDALRSRMPSRTAHAAGFDTVFGHAPPAMKRLSVNFKKLFFFIAKN